MKRRFEVCAVGIESGLWAEAQECVIPKPKSVLYDMEIKAGAGTEVETGAGTDIDTDIGSDTDTDKYIDTDTDIDIDAGTHKHR